MNHESSNQSHLLAAVDAASVRLVRVQAGELRRLVRIPIGGSLTVAVAARVADALLDAQPTDGVIVLPRDPASVPVATDFAAAFDVRHPGDRTVVLPDMETLRSIADRPSSSQPATGRRVLPRPSTTPRTIRLSPPSGV